MSPVGSSGWTSSKISKVLEASDSNSAVVEMEFELILVVQRSIILQIGESPTAKQRLKESKKAHDSSGAAYSVSIVIALIIFTLWHPDQTIVKEMYWRVRGEPAEIRTSDDEMSVLLTCD